MNMVIIGERFWKKVRKTDTCWLWEGYLDRNGYGQVRISMKCYYVHRASYEAAYGSIPSGQYILHKCDTPNCVRPDHLFPGTQRDNMEDCRRKKRMSCGESRYNSQLTEKNVKMIRESALSGQELSAMFNVSRSHIYDIKHRRRWKHVK